MPVRVGLCEYANAFAPDQLRILGALYAPTVPESTLSKPGFAIRLVSRFNALAATGTITPPAARLTISFLHQFVTFIEGTPRRRACSQMMICLATITIGISS